VAGIDRGHIDAVHIKIDAAEVAAIASTAKPHLYEGVQDIALNIAREEQDRSRAAEKVFSDACASRGGRGLSHAGSSKAAASYREATTLADEILHEARFHDLTIAARESELSPGRLEALVISAGKSILVPPAKPSKTIGSTIIVAWKDVPEAARAVTAAMPILTRAKQVIIVSVAESRTNGDTEHASAEGVIWQLKQHGIDAKLQMSSAMPVSAAERIKEIAYEANADLIVMGAYGHSRMREWVLGGTTRALLRDCDIAVLMVH
jgi:nucleotide-binding universal stress UspA family protein